MNKEQPEAKCPYFREKAKYRICCQGPGNFAEIEFRFPTEKAARIQYEAFCCRRFDYCEAYHLHPHQDEGQEANKSC